MKRTALSLKSLAALLLMTLIASHASADVVSTFDTNNNGWGSLGFANVGVGTPNFASVPVVSGVVFNAAGGNPGGFISKQDPDGNWQYFSAPAAFLGNQSTALGGNLTFNEITISNTQPALNPQGPLVAITNGSLILVFGGGGSTPAISGTSWNSFSVPLSASSWKVTNFSGATATSAEFSSVLSSLTGLYILSDFWTGSGANGETLGLDNVDLPASTTAAPEPKMTFLLLAGMGLMTARVSKLRSRKRTERSIS
jgi:hypothetical protein